MNGSKVGEAKMRRFGVLFTCLAVIPSLFLSPSVAYGTTPATGDECLNGTSISVTSTTVSETGNKCSTISADEEGTSDVEYRYAVGDRIIINTNHHWARAHGWHGTVKTVADPDSGYPEGFPYQVWPDGYSGCLYMAEEAMDPEVN